MQVASTLYKDWSIGLADLLKKNPGIPINSSDFFGTSLNYDPELIVFKNSLPVPISGVRIGFYKARKLQSHFDLAVQLYGDLSKIGEVLKNIDDINGEIPLGLSFDVPLQTDPAAIFFSSSGTIVQTDFVVSSLTADTTLFTADTTLLTADQTRE